MTHFQKRTHRKQRPLKDNEKASMATLLAKIRALREQAVNATPNTDKANCPIVGVNGIEG